MKKGRKDGRVRPAPTSVEVAQLEMVRSVARGFWQAGQLLMYVDGLKFSGAQLDQSGLGRTFFCATAPIARTATSRAPRTAIIIVSKALISTKENKK